MVNDKIILFYGFNEEDREKLETTIKKHINTNVIEISKSMGGMKLSDILEGKKAQVFNKTLPEEKVVIFNNYSDSEVESALKDIKLKLDKMPILAAVTETSLNWKFDYLLQHLIQEKEWFRNKKK